MSRSLRHLAYVPCLLLGTCLLWFCVVRDKLLGSRPHKVYLCGYELNKFAHKVFYDYDMYFYTRTCRPSRSDVLLVGMHATCEADSFPGKVVYVNGEPHRGAQIPKSYYLGPSSPQRRSVLSAIFGFMARRRDLQLFYASVAVLEFDPVRIEKVFNTRPSNSGEHFLMHVSSRCIEHRERALEAFSMIGKVHTGGKCRGGVITDSVNNRHIWKSTHELYRQKFKFGLVMENSDTHGYVTEKIFAAFLGGAIPIYWGSREVFSMFNEKAFVFYDVKAPQAALDQVKALLQNETAYQAMLSEPILAPGAYERFFWRDDHLVNEIRNFLAI